MIDVPPPMLPCNYCPRAEEVYKEQDATMFIMCVVKVPGEMPRIATTPTYAATPCGVDKLIDMIPGCAEALQRELKSPKDAVPQHVPVAADQ